MSLDTLDRRGDKHMCYSTFGLDRHYNRHHHHAYRRSDKGYFPNDFNKSKPPTFNGEMKKSQDAEAWLLGMRNFFRWHDYSESMKAKITSFRLKGKENIWWEDVKHVRGIKFKPH